MKTGSTHSKLNLEKQQIKHKAAAREHGSKKPLVVILVIPRLIVVESVLLSYVNRSSSSMDD